MGMGSRTKAWRLLRERFHGLFTYGCAPHAFHLHSGDICHIEEFSTLLSKVSVIINWFSHHLQAGGRASLSRIQKEIYGKESAPIKPGKTREWNGKVAASEWCIANHAALVRLVTESSSSTPRRTAPRAGIGSFSAEGRRSR